LIRAFLSAVLLLALAVGGLSQTASPANAETISTFKSGASFKADKVLVLKSERRMYLLHNGKTIKSYKISLGRNPKGKKIKQGDGRTPEGTYALDARNPNSKFYRSIHISYPNAIDSERARQLGVSPGGAIMIHGEPNHLQRIGFNGAGIDWTEGCIAVTNRDMDEIWKAIDDGTPIEIKP
jgi:murein L,D-transpeptidase YafK